VSGRPKVEVVPLREAAALLGTNTENARKILSRAGVTSGYPVELVEWAKENRPGRGKGGGRPKKLPSG
jgi:hypothetical protein